jgi:hypothetical protein
VSVCSNNNVGNKKNTRLDTTDKLTRTLTSTNYLFMTKLEMRIILRTCEFIKKNIKLLCNLKKKHIFNIELVMNISLKSHQKKWPNKHQQYKTKKNILQQQQQQQTFLSPKRPTFQLLKTMSGNTHD